jgi:hypothetical protein
VKGGHLLHFLTRRRGAAVRTPVFIRSSPVSGQRHKRGLAQPLSREFPGHPSAQNQSRSKSMEAVGREPAEKTTLGVDNTTVMLTDYLTVYDSLFL